MKVTDDGGYLEQFARIIAAYVLVRMLQRFDCIENAEVPPDAPLKFHHTIENRSGSGVWVRMHQTDGGNLHEFYPEIDVFYFGERKGKEQESG